MQLPNVCLVGVGHFGKSHLHEWLRLQEQGKVEVSALVVRTDKSKSELAEQFSIPVYTSLNVELLEKVDKMYQIDVFSKIPQINAF